MSERGKALIKIGGKFPSSLVITLCRIIDDDRLDFENYDYKGTQPVKCTRADLTAGSETSGLLELYDDDAKGAMLANLESFLETNNISFDRESEGTGPDGPCLTQYRPGMNCPETFEYGSDGDRMTPHADLREVLDTLTEPCMDLAEVQQQHSNAVEKLRRLLGNHIPPLKRFEIA